MILHAAAGELRHDGRTVWLTPFQSTFIATLAAIYPEHAINESIYCALWPDGEPGNAYTTLKVQICKIRIQLRKAGFPPLIGTVWGGRTCLSMPVPVSDSRCDVIPADLGRTLRSLLHTHPNHAAADRILAVLG